MVIRHGERLPGRTGKPKTLMPGTSAGYTFVEVFVAVMVLGIIAVSVMPTLSSADPEKLQLAASEVAATIRFARSEAMRTGEVHSVFVDEVNHVVVAEKTDLVAKPAAAESILYHPIAKQPYQLDLATNPATRGVEVGNGDQVFLFVGAGKQQRVMFDGTGVPIYIDTIANSTHLLQLGNIDLNLNEHGSGVVLEPFTGRVSIDG